MSDAAPPWVTAAEIAARWERLTASRVTAMARMIGLTGTSVHVRRPMEGRPEYSPAAVGLIERELRSRHYRRWVDRPRRPWF